MGGKIWVAAAVLATLSFVVTGQPGFTIYKFSLQWQPTACTGEECLLVQPQEKFTIRGLWPTNGNNDVLVKPYHNDTTCTGINPSPSGDVQRSIAPILTELEVNWPNLFLGTDLGLWETEWENHGMCSDYNNDPGAYFGSSLDIQTRFTNIPGDAGIALNVGYLADEIVDKVKQKFGVKPQITCNFNVATLKFQLWEIRYCYNRVWVLQDCPDQIDTSCPVSPDRIILPRAPPSPPPLLLHHQDEPLKKIQ